MTRTAAELKHAVRWLKQHGAAERAFAAELAGVFRDVGGAVLADVRALLDELEGDEDGLTEADIEDLLDVEDLYERVMAEAKPTVQRLVAAGAAAEFGLFQRSRAYAVWAKDRGREGRPEHDIDLPPALARAVDRHAADILSRPYWRDLAETVRLDVVRIVQRGVKTGRSNDAIAADLEDVLGEDGSAARAQRIARTESTGSLNGGAQAVREELAADGVALRKGWLIIDDDDTRPDHEDADGQTVAVEEAFVVGGEECQYPGDPDLSAAQRVNCRCTNISVFDMEE